MSCIAVDAHKELQQGEIEVLSSDNEEMQDDAPPADQCEGNKSIRVEDNKRDFWEFTDKAGKAFYFLKYQSSYRTLLTCVENCFRVARDITLSEPTVFCHLAVNQTHFV
eukprot:3935255-Amphidinium_carterae.1